MDQILETIIHGLIARIEVLEKGVKLLKENKGASQNYKKPYTPNKQINPSTTEPASEEQLKYAKDLGMLDNITGKLTKAECAVLIKEGLVRREKEKNDKTTSYYGNNAPQQEKHDKSVESKGLPGTKEEVSTTESGDGESPVEETKTPTDEMNELIKQEQEFDDNGAYL